MANLHEIPFRYTATRLFLRPFTVVVKARKLAVRWCTNDLLQYENCCVRLLHFRAHVLYKAEKRERCGTVIAKKISISIYVYILKKHTFKHLNIKNKKYYIFEKRIYLYSYD